MVHHVKDLSSDWRLGPGESLGEIVARIAREYSGNLDELARRVEHVGEEEIDAK